MRLAAEKGHLTCTVLRVGQAGALVYAAFVGVREVGREILDAVVLSLQCCCELGCGVIMGSHPKLAQESGAIKFAAASRIAPDRAA